MALSLNYAKPWSEDCRASENLFITNVNEIKLNCIARHGVREGNVIRGAMAEANGMEDYKSEKP